MPNDMERQTLIVLSVKRNWGWLLGLGIIFVLLGFLGLSMVVGITVFSMWFLGVLLLIGGLSQLVDVVKSRRWKGIVWHAFIALLYLAGGGVVIYDPLLASTIITAMIAWMLILIGITRLIMGFAIRETPGFAWLFIAGLASLVLGLLILIQWPWSGLWVIGLFIAIDMIMNGWTYIFMALSMRQSGH